MNPHTDVLVVDDEQVVRGAVRKICATEQLTVDEAESVEAGLERLEQPRYRIVLLDLMLPANGGTRLLQAARKSQPDVPVVMITGYATPERRIECLRRGAFDVLPKPFDANELIAVLRRALEFAVDPKGVAAGPDREAVWMLGQHAWARIESGGTALIGIGESFRSLLGASPRIETPAVDDELIQGKRMATITDRDGLRHRVWSPLGGRILKTNHVWEDDQWVLRVAPTDLENDLEWLTRI